MSLGHIFRQRCFVCSTETRLACPCGVSYCSTACQAKHRLQHELHCEQFLSIDARTGSKRKSKKYDEEEKKKGKRDKSPKRRTRSPVEESEEEIAGELQQLNRQLVPLQQVFHDIDPDDEALREVRPETLQRSMDYHAALIERLKTQRALRKLSADEEAQLRESTAQLAILSAAMIVSREYVGKIMRAVDATLRFAESKFPTVLAFLSWTRSVLPVWFNDISQHMRSWGDKLAEYRPVTYSNLGLAFRELGQAAVGKSVKATAALFVFSLKTLPPKLKIAFSRLSQAMREAKLSGHQKKQARLLRLEIMLLNKALGDAEFDQQEVRTAIVEREAELGGMGLEKQ